MNNLKQLNKIRSVRFTNEQEEIFNELEKRGYSISKIIRKAVELELSSNQYLMQDKYENDNMKLSLVK
jgi:hypothetical protein